MPSFRWSYLQGQCRSMLSVRLQAIKIAHSQHPRLALLAVPIQEGGEDKFQTRFGNQRMWDEGLRCSTRQQSCCTRIACQFLKMWIRPDQGATSRFISAREGNS